MAGFYPYGKKGVFNEEFGDVFRYRYFGGVCVIVVASFLRQALAWYPATQILAAFVRLNTS